MILYMLVFSGAAIFFLLGFLCGDMYGTNETKSCWENSIRTQEWVHDREKYYFEAKIAELTEQLHKDEMLTTYIHK